MYKLCMRSENCGHKSNFKKYFSEDLKPPLHSTDDITHSSSEHSVPFIQMGKFLSVFPDLRENRLANPLEKS